MAWLQTLDLGFNQLTGSVDIGYSAFLVNLRVDHNALSGSVPHDLATGLTVSLDAFQHPFLLAMHCAICFVLTITLH